MDALQPGGDMLNLGILESLTHRLTGRFLLGSDVSAYCHCSECTEEMTGIRDSIVRKVCEPCGGKSLVADHYAEWHAALKRRLEAS
jgi:hypothetical protein